MLKNLKVLTIETTETNFQKVSRLSRVQLAKKLFVCFRSCRMFTLTLLAVLNCAHGLILLRFLFLPHTTTKRLPHMAKCLEEHLYRTASTKEEYMDLSTLKARLELVALGLAKIRNRTPRSSSGLSPTRRVNSLPLIPTATSAFRQHHHVTMMMKMITPST